MLYNEITASSLVKVDMQGHVVEAGTPNIVAVSSTKAGLLYLSQESCLVGDVSYHNYEGLVVEKSEWDSLSRGLGVHNKVMMLRNHGAVCCGETIEEAFFYAYHLVLACDTQLKMAPMGLDNLITIEEPTRRKVFEAGQRGGGGVDSNSEGGPAGSGAKSKKWSVGEMEFEALMRMMDNAGYRTGYIYKQPLVKEEPPKPKSDVELPAAVSSLGFLLEEENLYKDGPPSKSTPIKVESPNQFVPLGTTKKEFKRIQAAMKEGRRAGGITAGPESKVLDGPTWDEARQMQMEGKTVVDSGVDFRVGAASKGIIQRDFQHHATVFKSAYAKNPFDNISEDELAEYKRIIDAKARGDVTDSSLADGGPNSTFEGDHTFNGEETDGNRTFSEGEGDTSKATDTEMASPRKEKKKKSGLRTPSFLKKKKKDKKKDK